MATPEYINILRRNDGKTYDVMSDGEIELTLAREPDSELREMTGLTQNDHRIRASLHIFPNRELNPWREKKFESVYICEKNGEKEDLWLGCFNSGKTTDMGDILLLLWWEAAQDTTILLASPTKEATDTKLWATVREQFYDAKDRFPNLPGHCKESEFQIELGPRNPRAIIKVATMDEVGKLVGQKKKDPRKGRFVIGTDELPDFPNNGSALIEVLGNLKSVPNFMLLGAGNFADPTDCLGQLAIPESPMTYEMLDGNRDFMWKTRRKGRVFRFDAEYSPNVLDPTAPWIGLPTLETIKETERDGGGKTSPAYMRWVKSMPVVGLEEFTVTNISKIDAGYAKTEPLWGEARLTKLAFCDAGFGGDPAILQKFKFGTNAKGVQNLALWDPPVVVPIDVTLIENGVRVTAETQIVRFCKAHCKEHGIPDSQFGFDGSMRAGIVQEFDRGMSTAVIAIDFGGPATERTLAENAPKFGEKKVRKRWKDEVTSFVGELWMFTAIAIQVGQFRNLQLSPRGEEQLCARRWKWQDKKKHLETKKEFKSHNFGKSPNEADAIVGGMEIARKLGFSVVVMLEGEKQRSILDTLAQMKKERGVKQYLQNALPPGRLRSNKPETTPLSARFNKKVR